MLYKRIYESLRESIEQGEYRVGDKLPSVAELTESFSVSAITIKRSLDLLRDDGYIVRRPRLGTVVTSVAPTKTAAPTAENGNVFIGCVFTSFDDTFGNRVIEGLLAAAGPHVQPIIKRSLGDVDEEDACIRSLVDAGVSGIILLPSSSEYIAPAALELVMRHFPIVILDRFFDGVPISAVSSDNLAGAKMATEHLLELGHRTVGYVSAASHVSTSEERRNGYVHAHATFHLPLENTAELRTVASTIPGSSVTKEHDIDQLVNFVRSHPEITGYFAAEYNIALMLREACRRLGLAVPTEVSIICFDHPEAYFDDGMFRFTHIRQAQRELGERAVEMVLKQLDHQLTVRHPEPRSPGVEKVSIPTQLVQGDSTAPPPM